MEDIFLYYFLQDVAKLYLGKLRSFERCLEVEVGKINPHESCSWCGNDSVEEYVDEEEHGCVASNIIWVVDDVPAHGHTGAVGFLLLGVHRVYRPDICDIFPAITGIFRFANELDGIGDINTHPNALGKATKFVGSRNVPGIFEFGVL